MAVNKRNLTRLDMLLVFVWLVSRLNDGVGFGVELGVGELNLADLGGEGGLDVAGGGSA